MLTFWWGWSGQIIVIKHYHRSNLYNQQTVFTTTVLHHAHVRTHWRFDCMSFVVGIKLLSPLSRKKNKEASRLYAELLPSRADDMHASRRHVDDMQMMCRWHMSSASEISPKISLSCRLHIIRMSSAHHVVCMRFQPQKYFQLNSRATALLMILLSFLLLIK